MLLLVHTARNISIVVHGDDFTILGMRRDLMWVRDGLAAKFEVGDQTILGTEKCDAQQARILNRILTVTKDGLQYEADPRHDEHLTSALRMHECRFTGVPGVKKRDILSEEESPVEEYSEKHAPDSPSKHRWLQRRPHHNNSTPIHSTQQTSHAPYDTTAQAPGPPSKTLPRGPAGRSNVRGSRMTFV